MNGHERTVLQGLLDRQAITDVLNRYARACDRADEVLLRSCFHADSRHRHGGFDGSSADFCAFAMKIILGTRLEKHLITNVMIELDGDLATTECHYLAYHRQPDAQTGADVDYFNGGRFIDRFERRAGEWRIAERLGLIDYEAFHPVTERGVARLLPSQRSQRVPDDPLYSLMPSLRNRG
ncbi:MAG: nuclear transport factor 2 family protein [Steroidobacteraceae bacterium]